MPRAAARSIALALVVLGALWSPATGSDRSLRASGFVASCKLAGDKLVEANRYARVYYNAEDEDIGICRPGQREPDLAPLAEAVYPRPAIDLVGPYLGYAATATEGQENVDIVAIVDVRSMDPRFITDLQGGVGSLRVNRRGSIAWIVCPNGSLSAGLHCGPNGPAFPPRSVYRHDSRSTREQEVQLIASSHRIEVRSLSRRKNQIRWKEAGTIRRASLR